MKQKTILSYSLDLILSNKYLEVVIQCLEPKILNKKVDILFFFFFYLKNKISTLSLSILGFTHSMIVFKYLFGRANSQL